MFMLRPSAHEAEADTQLYESLWMIYKINYFNKHSLSLSGISGKERLKNTIFSPLGLIEMGHKT